MLDYRFPTALQMVLSVAMAEQSGERSTSAILAYGLEANPSFIRKLMVPLTRDGIIVSTLGRNGSIHLGRPAEEITLRDIVSELEKPARDPRDEMPKPILRTDVMDMKDLAPGMVLKGTVRNVIDFGAFVDIGVHQDGLVHISQMTDRYIKHPLEAVSVGDIVEVKVLGVDLAKKRISLTMKL